MGLYKYINRIEKLDGMIRRKSTGPPAELAEKLGISERWLYKLLDELKVELNCPIRYDSYQQSYVYKEPGTILIGFQKNLSREEKQQVSGGKINFKKKFITVCICSVGVCKLRLKLIINFN